MSEIHVLVNKASPMISTMIVPNLKIEAKGIEVQMGDLSFENMRAAYMSQANAVVEAMFATLPGGLVDAILVELMRHKLSVLEVPYMETHE